MGWRAQKNPSRGFLRWAGFGAVAVVASIGGGLMAAPIAARGVVRALSLIVTGSVWLATSVGSGDDAWTIAGTVLTACGSALASPQALGAFGVLLLVGALALFGLKRLLDSEAEESHK